MKILVTGCAGFIGHALSAKLLEQGHNVIGLDNLSPYYDVNLKKKRLKNLESQAHFSFNLLDLTDKPAVEALFAKHNFDAVMHLAAQAGVRYSIDNPQAYIDSNLIGFANILEGCRSQKVAHLIFASTSSVYGLNTKQPFSEHDNVDHPISLYAATKKANELMAHSYAHLYGLPCTGLRFFTVYGPWGRPDMALFKFTKNILADKPIDVYNHGNMIRDFTYVDDVVEGMLGLLDKAPEIDENWDGKQPDPATSSAPYRIYNIGNHNPVKLTEFISALEKALGKKAQQNLMPLQPGDVASTYADVSDLNQTTGRKPETSITAGVAKFVEWYLKHYHKTAESYHG